MITGARNIGPTHYLVPVGEAGPFGKGFVDPVLPSLPIVALGPD